MPVITMNVPCSITSRAGSDVYGQPKFGPSVKTKCAVLRFELGRQKTSPKATASGTQGHADETVANIHVLLGKKEIVSLNDFFELRGTTARVSAITPRYDVMGRLDHIQVEATIE